MRTHVAVYSETPLGWRWCCTTCQHLGQEKYPTHDHARKAFWLHAEYADRPRRSGPTRGTGRHVVSVNGRPVP